MKKKVLEDLEKRTATSLNLALDRTRNRIAGFYLENGNGNGFLGAVLEGEMMQWRGRRFKVNTKKVVGDWADEILLGIKLVNTLNYSHYLLYCHHHFALSIHFLF